MPQFAISSKRRHEIKYFLFWAISKDKDATFFLDYIGDRGVKPGAEFRYALAEEFKGNAYASIISDRKYDNTRYQVKLLHEQVMMKDLTFRSIPIMFRHGLY
jgi:lipopolysaccharide assembly outer membrane protein LptD (OstA)